MKLHIKSGDKNESVIDETEVMRTLEKAWMYHNFQKMR